MATVTRSNASSSNPAAGSHCRSIINAQSTGSWCAAPRASPVVAAPDRGLVIVVEAAPQHLAAAVAAADLDHAIAATLADAGCGRGLALPPGRFDGGADLAAVRADMARCAVHHDLGRV